jgi:hypothetical protein
MEEYKKAVELLEKAMDEIKNCQSENSELIKEIESFLISASIKIESYDRVTGNY